MAKLYHYLAWFMVILAVATAVAWVLGNYDINPLRTHAKWFDSRMYGFIATIFGVSAGYFFKKSDDVTKRKQL